MISGKKRVRGLRRKARHIKEWLRNNLELGFDENASRDWLKLHINPWYSLHRPRVPYGLRVQMILGLVEIYESWKKRLDESGEEYYLAIWLFKNRFIQSQVVMARREELARYDNVFFAPKEKRRFDGNDFKPIHDVLARFAWEPMFSCVPLEEENREDFPDEESWGMHQDWVEFAKKNNFAIETHNGKQLFLLKEDDVWIGKKLA